MLWKSKKRSLHYFFTHPPEEYAAGQLNHSLIMSFLIKSFSDFVGDNTDLKGISFVWRIFLSAATFVKRPRHSRSERSPLLLGKRSDRRAWQAKGHACLEKVKRPKHIRRERSPLPGGKRSDRGARQTKGHASLEKAKRPKSLRRERSLLPSGKRSDRRACRG